MSITLTEWEISHLISTIGEELRRSKVEGRDQVIIEALDALYHKIQNAHIEMLREQE